MILDDFKKVLNPPTIDLLKKYFINDNKVKNVLKHFNHMGKNIGGENSVNTVDSEYRHIEDKKRTNRIKL
ncbi:hypothetical protein [uncultured Methanobrevibacter sp.]|uniref:hypothetical protein n=1 Tax=uncultured Methanobrevibacter sp. TaxID=253161 RepID=UPI0025EDFB6E|nr:hypothetical protein [uncultured Methanobrevibacter sp.]